MDATLLNEFVGFAGLLVSEIVRGRDVLSQEDLVDLFVGDDAEIGTGISTPAVFHGFAFFVTFWEELESVGLREGDRDSSITSGLRSRFLRGL
jgi:hypothetical protein